MVAQQELTDAEIDRVFHALADATRRDIVRRTIAGELSISSLAADYDMSFAAVQKHVTVLESARLIVKRAEGRERLVRADPAMIARARILLARFEDMWRARIDRLDALLAEPETASMPAERPSTTEGSSTTERPSTTEGPFTTEGE